MMNKTILMFVIIASIIVASCVTAMSEPAPSHMVYAVIDSVIIDKKNSSGDLYDIVGVVVDTGSFFSSRKKEIMFADIKMDNCDVVRYSYIPETYSDTRQKIVFYCR